MIEIPTRSHFLRNWRQAVWQMGLIVVLAAVAALVVNHYHPDGLPLVADWSPEARLAQDSGGSLVIPLEEASDLFSGGQAIFLDARSPELYELGHIAGARNLPWEKFAEHYPQVVADIPKDATLITYCDGEGCELSEELGLALLTEGYANVRVLVNGWSRWTGAGLPVSAGALPGRS
jgi:rhodanese-related sulfurtransferase